MTANNLSAKGEQREASMTDEIIARNKIPSRNSFFRKIQFFERFAAITKRSSDIENFDDEEGL